MAALPGRPSNWDDEGRPSNWEVLQPNREWRRGDTLDVQCPYCDAQLLVKDPHGCGFGVVWEGARSRRHDPRTKVLKWDGASWVDDHDNEWVDLDEYKYE